MSNPFNEYRKKEKTYETASKVLRYTGFASVFYTAFACYDAFSITPLVTPFLFNGLSIVADSKSKKAQEQRKALTKGEEIKDSRLSKLCGFS